MPTVPIPLSRRATRSMWRAEWDDDDSLTRAQRAFLACLSRFVSHGARIEWTGIGVVIEQFSSTAGRPYTQRHVLRLLAWATGRGLIRRARHSAPGRPALYEAVIPGHPGYAPARVRRRGIRPRRLLARWRAELAPERAQLAQEEPGPTRRRHRHRLRDPADWGP